MAVREKQIQIPADLFWQMAAYCLEDSSQSEELRNIIQRGIYAKTDRIVEHDLYTKYKTAPTAEQREQARKEYLEKRGIHPDFRW